ncbi:ComEC/Rec2 family competence protein [Henriciella marina]|uniref:ComEC/Rec2 family competence protein n=1 Tax=Henriciella marina TaxID=453851 RepID=A0ABT4LXI7_9PROT|nr:ComEC/Rec2 family competence protein [Henriciella marina]MCZ4299089.1 ComEC/Rec2 family competence protein [Henriciella marina]
MLHLVLNGPLYFALGLCLGAIVYFTLPFEPTLLVLLVLAAAANGAVFFGLRNAEGFALRLVLILIIGAVCGAMVSKIHTMVRPVPPVHQMIGPTMIEGWVNAVEPGEKGVRLRIDVHAIGGIDPERLPKRIRLTHSLSLNVSPGRFVRCWAVLRPPPQPGMPGDYAFNRQAFFDGLDGVGYVQGRCRGGTLGAQLGFMEKLRSTVSVMRRSLAIHVRDAAGDRAGGFAAALASGDRSFMERADVEALRRAGLAHLLAISGLHLGIVGGLVYVSVRRVLSLWEWFALRVPVQKPAAAVALTMTALYLVLSGASISTQRAFIMAAVFFGAILLDRSPLSFRSFAVAMAAVILIQPHSVMTPGFQMSFAATGALIATYLVWRERRQVQTDRTSGNGFVFTLQSLVVTSIVGAAATAPFALYHFDRVAPGGLWANLLAMPIITFVSAPLAGLALATAPIGLDEPFLRLFGWSLEQVLKIAHWVSNQPGSDLMIRDPMPAGVLLVLSMGLIAVCLVKGVRYRLLAGVGTVFAASVVWLSVPALVLHWSASGEVLLRDAENGWLKLAIAEGDGLSPLTLNDLPVSNECLGKTCEFETSAGTIAIIGGLATCIPNTALTLLVEASRGHCWPKERIITWEDVQEAGGLSLVRGWGGASHIRDVACGRRKWQPCIDRTEN